MVDLVSTGKYKATHGRSGLIYRPLASFRCYLSKGRTRGFLYFVSSVSARAREGRPENLAAQGSCCVFLTELLGHFSGLKGHFSGLWDIFPVVSTYPQKWDIDNICPIGPNGTNCFLSHLPEPRPNGREQNHAETKTPSGKAADQRCLARPERQHEQRVSTWLA